MLALLRADGIDEGPIVVMDLRAEKIEHVAGHRRETRRRTCGDCKPFPSQEARAGRALAGSARILTCWPKRTSYASSAVALRIMSELRIFMPSVMSAIDSGCLLWSSPDFHFSDVSIHALR